MDKHQMAVLAVFGIGAWVGWLLFSLLRQYLFLRSQAAAQDNVLNRVSSPESLEVFLASDSGKQFLRSLEPNPKEAWRGIIRSVETAVTFAAIGTGTLLYHVAFPETDSPLPLAFGAFVLAAAFGASAVVSLLLHRRSGLLPSGRE